MGTTAEKLYKILDSKEEIKKALIAKGINITDETTFAEYAEKINEITNGGAITDEEALLFIKDIAEGKRKIAKAVRNKYEGTSGTASEITEYSTFDELSNKISQIPVEVPLGNAMEQNGGVLPFYDVYNEALKAMKEFAGYGFNGCCAFELDKWNYDDDHKVTLSGADAYYTSDRTFIKENIIYKNGTQIGEFSGEHRFMDQEEDNLNRFVVYFFEVDNFVVPSISFEKNILNFFVIKGSASFVVDALFERIFSIIAFYGDLTVSSENVLQIKQNSNVKRLILANVKEITGGNQIIYSNSGLLALSFPNLTSISGIRSNASILSSNTNLRVIDLPNLRTINVNLGVRFIQDSTKIENIYFPKLEICNNCYVVYNGTSLKLISMPNLRESANMLLPHSVALGAVLELGNPIGGSIRIAAGQPISNIKEVKIKKGFKSTLNLSYLTALTADCINAIIDNLAICEGEDKDKYTITLSKSVATTEMESAIVAKGYLFATLG